MAGTTHCISRFRLVPCFLLVISSISCTQPSRPVHQPESGKQIYRSTGVIKAADRSAGRVTVDHEEIPGYMSAMEMTEPVSDPGVLDGIQVGDRVEFELERTGSNLLITSIKKIGEDAMVRGAEIYRINCSECHGPTGEGVTKKGIPLTSGHALHHSEAEHIKQVTFGEGEKMPAFRDKLSEAEIRQVVNFVRGSLQKNVERDPSSKHKH